MWVLDTSYDKSKHGVFTEKPGIQTNDYFKNLLDLCTTWKPYTDNEYILEGRDRKTGYVKWTATHTDLIFGSNSELRAVAEIYASSDGEGKFITDFIAVWNKVMNRDHFDQK